MVQRIFQGEKFEKNRAKLEKKKLIMALGKEEIAKRIAKE
jgi:hypothetical protein